VPDGALARNHAGLPVRAGDPGAQPPAVADPLMPSRIAVNP
jgi:hypothetical protein